MKANMRNSCWLETYPVSSAKVNCFCEVVALIEATVISSREGNYKLSSTLIGPDDLQMQKRNNESRDYILEEKKVHPSM